MTYPAARPRFFFNIPSPPFVARRRLQHRSLKQRPSGRQWWAAGHVSENIDGTRHVVGPSGAVLMSWAPWVRPMAGAAPSCVVDMRSPRPVVGQLARPPSKFSAEGGSTTSQKAGIRSKCHFLCARRPLRGGLGAPGAQFDGSSGCYCHHAHLARTRGRLAMFRAQGGASEADLTRVPRKSLIRARSRRWSDRPGR